MAAIFPLSSSQINPFQSIERDLAGRVGFADLLHVYDKSPYPVFTAYGYSYRNDSTGLTDAAFMAGKSPDRMPIMPRIATTIIPISSESVGRPMNIEHVGFNRNSLEPLGEDVADQHTADAAAET